MTYLALLPQLGPLELVLILAVVLIVFGVGRLPEVGGAMGRAIREFRREQAKAAEEEETAKLKEKSPSEEETTQR